MQLNQAQTELNKATTKSDLYKIAGQLNNRPEHVLVDKVTGLAFTDFDHAKKLVQAMINESMEVLKKETARNLRKL